MTAHLIYPSGSNQVFGSLSMAIVILLIWKVFVEFSSIVAFDVDVIMCD